MVSATVQVQIIDEKVRASRRPVDSLTTARDGGLTVPCVKGEYALRINEIRDED